MAEKYGLVHLVNEITVALKEDLVVTAENVEEISETAQAFSYFENVSLALAEKCSSYSRNHKHQEERLTSPGFLSSALSVASSAATSVRSWIGGTSERKEETGTEILDVPDQETRTITTINPAEANPSEENCSRMSEKVKMSLRSISWVDFLYNNTDLPRDITFKLYDKSRSTKGEVSNFVGEIKAHKFLLASCSEVFKEKFFSPSNHHINELRIEDSSLREAVKIGRKKCVIFHNRP